MMFLHDVLYSCFGMFSMLNNDGEKKKNLIFLLRLRCDYTPKPATAASV